MQSSRPTNILFTEVSANKKTGPVATSISESKTCALSCPFKKHGCYARYGPTSWSWNRLDNGTATGLVAWNDFLAKLRRLHRGALFRHNVAGDLDGNGKRINRGRLAELTAAVKGKVAWAYTHHLVTGDGADAKSNRDGIAAANRGGFAVNLSGNNLEHADKLANLGIAPVVSVVPLGSPDTQFTKSGHKVILCPAQTRENVTCSSCKLCAKTDRGLKCNGGKQLIVGFLPHGMGAKYVQKVVTVGSLVPAAAG